MDDKTVVEYFGLLIRLSGTPWHGHIVSSLSGLWRRIIKKNDDDELATLNRSESLETIAARPPVSGILLPDNHRTLLQTTNEMKLNYSSQSWQFSERRIEIDENEDGLACFIYWKWCSSHQIDRMSVHLHLMYVNYSPPQWSEVKIWCQKIILVIFWKNVSIWLILGIYSGAKIGDLFVFRHDRFYVGENHFLREKNHLSPGLELTTFCSWVRTADHYTTRSRWQHLPGRFSSLRTPS